MKSGRLFTSPGFPTVEQLQYFVSFWCMLFCVNQRKADRKEMNTVLKKTIREEIKKKYSKEKEEGSKSEGILPVNTSPANPRENMKSKAPQTERRLSNLLEKI